MAGKGVAVSPGFFITSKKGGGDLYPAELIKIFSSTIMAHSVENTRMEYQRRV